MEPFGYQIECRRELEWFKGRALLAAEPGLGKTFISLLYLQRHRKTLPCVVVCPASVKYVWEREASLTTDFTTTVIEGQNSTVPVPRSDLVIINYDILRFWATRLRRINPGTVILDESQYLQSGDSKRTKAARRLCKERRRVLALSGTPLVNRPIELFPTLNILQPDVFNNYMDFAQEFCDPRLSPWGWQYKGATNTKKLHALLVKTCMVRRRKADVLKDLPDKLRAVVPLPIKRRQEYNLADADFLGWLKGSDPAAAKRAARAEAMTKVGYLLRLVAELKLPSIVEWANDWMMEHPGEKLVAFAVHREMVAGLKKGCRAKSVILDGSTSKPKRKQVVDQFVDDKETRLFIGNIKAAGTGLDRLQYASSSVAMTEIPWTPGVLSQAEDRCHRIGSKNTVWVHYLVARRTIEVGLCELVQQKQRTLDAILDGGPVVGSLDVFDELLKQIIGTL